MNVLSLFDGMSCGQIALNRAGIKYEKYYASEIDKNAIKVTMNNYPNTIQLGSVVNIKSSDLPKIDLLIGGSPCTGFSVAGKGLNFNDPQSILFFEYVRLLKEYKPKYFLLENVKMKKEWEEVITKYLGVNPIHINSNLFSAQNRKRVYWTNIPIEPIPEDKGIMLKDILEPYGFENYKVDNKRLFIFLNKEVEIGKIGYFGLDSQANRVYSIHGKSVTLCGQYGGGADKMGQYLFGCITPDRINKRQNGQRFSTGEKFYTLTAQDMHGILKDGYIRKLMPIECERLQTVPDNYTQGVSDTARYKMLGNGWTIDVIAYLFSYLA